MSELQRNDPRIFPNPSSEAVTLELPGDFNYQLCDATGRKVLRGEGAGTETIRTSALPCGVYLITIQPPGRLPMVRKLVISR
jgi:hypothetical protein